MKFLTLIFLLFINIFGAELIDITQKPKADLEAIEHHAIKFGSGEASKVYVFVDPLCEFSRALMKKIYENKMLQLSNSYYVFFYRLPILDSEYMMQYILESKDPKETLIEVMIDKEIVDVSGYKAKSQTIKAIKEIAEVAATLDMKQRPYMISFDKDSKFCRVSEGSVSCLEEFE
ncbi:hypothetical protein Suden_0760 [Sulfurimonas denitrificans DSM 1251]|uniref:Thioredoxin-like fold domain-containing protein n=1 Tax=Sulfurimonas denitrificans (strain ATCC 33889 / DSM 1251) TaxID=326298 RepID=Q30SJ2_SULDN|nr:hypothetical protein [Sulfurimonas denitrificans]ABB44039.1 hypothetical protein Suden_0760 [Sulfurimonas denitrificans DSM 1251]MDD3443399.1 hypothetical protein [Sulfurimonas denitrificans]